MKISFNHFLKDLEGIPNEALNVGKLLAQAIVYQGEGDCEKLGDMAISLFKGEAVHFDKADQKLVCSIVKASKYLTILAKMQILELFEKNVPVDNNPTQNN